MLIAAFFGGKTFMGENNLRPLGHIVEFHGDVGRRSLVGALPPGPGEGQAIMGQISS